MSKLSFNRSPYFDDFQSNRNFMKVLFTPAVPVQVRELNQIQSIFANQVERFANHIFKNGSRVSNARVSYNSKAYVRLDTKSPWLIDNSHPNGYDVDVSKLFSGMTLIGNSSGITAILSKAVSAELSDPPTLYIVYTGVAIDGKTSTFIPGEVITIYDKNGIAVYSVKVKCPGCAGSTDLDSISPTGFGKIFSIDEGVFFFEGMFIENLKQEIIISKYGQNVNCKAGFDFVQTIVNSDNDQTLFDNALGYPNYSAPGAHRYKIDLKLVKRNIEIEDGENFILLAKFENGSYRYMKSDSEYSDIMDMIAKRTFETNGNFTVKPFSLRFIEDKAESVSDPKGYSVDGDVNYVRAVIGDGISYVKGYRFENTGEQYIKMRKARDTQKTASFTKFFEDRTYIFLQPLVSYSAYPNNPLVPSNTDGTVVSIYDGQFDPVSKLPTGSVIGTFKVYDVMPEPTKGTINTKGVVSGFVVENSGSGYTSAPTVSLSGDGTGASAVATISGGKVVSVTALTAGSGYTFAPTVTLTGGGGSNARVRSQISGPGVFRYYIYDLRMIAGKKLSDGKSFADSSQTNGFKAVPWNDLVNIYNPGQMEMIWKLDRDNIKTLRSISDSGNPNPPGSISIMLRKKMAGVFDSTGSITFTSFTNEYFEPFDPAKTVAIMTDNDAGAGIIHTVDLSGSGAFSRTPTSITIKLGTTYNVGGSTNVTVPGNTLTLIHNVLRTNAQEDSKEYSEVELSSVVPTANEIPLGVSDVYKILYVNQIDITNASYSEDITSRFVLNKKIEDSAYMESTVKMTSGTVPSNSNIRWKIKVAYYSHNTSNNLGYYTIDSYKQLIADGYLQYDENITHTANNKQEYPIFGSFDFRPSIVGSSVVGSSIPVIGSTAIFDIEYYLGRIDLLCVNKNSELYVKKGIPSESPIPPKVDEDSMALYEIHLKPYTYSIDDIRVKFIENKRYTMRDIGKIEERLKVIEYYTVLNLLEKRANDMSIKDANGFDRFKNGFIADNFMDYQAGDVASSDFRAALDRKYRELRPSFTPRNKRLKVLTAESKAKFMGKMAINDYSSVVIDEQPYATKHISINPHFQFKKMGEMFLTPNNDVWADINRQPELVLNVDTGVDEIRKIANAAGIIGTNWGSWADLNRTVNTGSTSNTVAGGGTSTTTTTTSTANQQRSGTKTSIDSRTDSYDFGDRVTDVTIIPYMRKSEIGFFATKMKKNTKVWAFFDKKPVSEFVRPLNGVFGQQLVTDGLGQISGTFSVPVGQFFTGDRMLYLTSDEKLTGDPDLETTAAEAIFFSGGLNVSKQRTTMNVITPSVKLETMTENRTVTSTSSSTNVNCPPGLAWNGSSCVAPPPPPRRCGECGNCAGCSDPVAQSFKLERDHFITGFDVFFKEIDQNPEEIFFQLRNMVNGYPGQTILSEKRIENTLLTKSEDSTVPYHIEFDFPVYCQGKTEYCIVIGGYSPDTRLWVAKMGQEVINIPGKIIETQPAAGSSFRSQNASTWNAEQLEDIKFVLYAAKFKEREMFLKFEHVPEKVSLGRDPFESEANKNKIRVHALDHGFIVNDKVTISSQENSWIEISVTEGTMQVGLRLTTPNGFEGIICDYRTNQVKSEIRLSGMKGVFAQNDQFVCEAMDSAIHDNYLISKMGYKSQYISNDGLVRFNRVAGVIKSSYFNPVNGIPISDLSKKHTIIEVDSMDSFIIQIPTNATTSGRFGGEDVWLEMNEKYEVFNVSGAYLPYGSSEKFVYSGIGHNPLNGVFVGQDYSPMEPRDIILGDDNHLGQPHKMVCTDNKSSGGRMVNVTATFENDDEWLSPVVNTDTWSIITVSNRVEWITSAQFSVEPNAIGRYRSESDPMNGSENYKYVTKTINLKNPASDLIIAFDVYKEINSDFDLWIKVLAPYEGTNIDNKRWARVRGIDKSHNSADLVDRVDYELTLSKFTIDVYTNDTVFTTVPWSQLFDGQFSSFKVKIVGRAKNPAKPPLFQSFRAIAVT